MPASTILISYDGTDITDLVLFNSASFESQSNALPGTFDVTVRDKDQSLNFVTGKEIGLWVDGIKLFGGFVTQITRKHAVPVADSTIPASVETRQWNLRGVDYNILFDKRVMRNTGNYFEQLPNAAAGSWDGDLVKSLCSQWLDLPAGLDTTSRVESITSMTPFGTDWAWQQQGTVWRKQMEDFANHSGAVWYIDPEARLIYRSLENSEAKWGFSDVPNHRTVTTTPDSFQGATYGFREVDLVEDGSNIVSDAFVWGGSEFSGNGETVFARATNADSLARYGLWQYAEVRFGQTGYKQQESVDLRADIIVNGAPGAADNDQNRGLRFAQWQVKLAWFSHDVPTIATTKQHLRPGDLVTFWFYVMHDSTYPQGLILQLPLRSVRLSFPGLDANGDAYVRFEGHFSLQLSDPYTLWRYLLARANRVRSIALATADNSSTTTVYGAYGQFIPTPTPNGSATTFDLPNDIGYIAGTTEVYVNGLRQRPGSEYEESNPSAGELRFFSAPATGDKLFVVCRTTAS